MRKRQLLLVGPGRWGSAILRTLAGHPAAACGGVVVRPGSRAGTGALKRFESLVEALNGQAWDGVIVTTPPDQHPEALAELARWNFPVLVSKPVALSYEATLALHRLWAGRRMDILVDHIYLHHPDFQNLRHAGHSVREIFSVGGGDGPVRGTYSSLWDYGPHDLSMTLALLPEQAPVRSSIRCEPAPSPGRANYAVELEFADAKARLYFGNGFPERRREFFVVDGRGRRAGFIDLGMQGPHRPLVRLIDEFIKPAGERDAFFWGMDRELRIAAILDGISSRL